MGVQGQRALVTGGSAGIGAAIVRQLVRDGFAVTFCDLDGDKGGALARETGAHCVVLDGTDGAAVQALFVAQGTFDVLVNNIGADQHSFFTDTDARDWRQLLSVNLESAFAFTKHALPGMQKNNYGRIVMTSSSSGLYGNSACNTARQQSGDFARRSCGS